MVSATSFPIANNPTMSLAPLYSCQIPTRTVQPQLRAGGGGGRRPVRVRRSRALSLPRARSRRSRALQRAGGKARGKPPAAFSVLGEGGREASGTSHRRRELGYFSSPAPVPTLPLRRTIHQVSPFLTPRSGAPWRGLATSPPSTLKQAVAKSASLCRRSGALWRAPGPEIPAA